MSEEKKSIHATVCISVRGKSAAPSLSKCADDMLDISPRLDAPLDNINDRYDILEQFAEGGFSTVSVAQDKNLRRFVAIKSLKPEVKGRDTFITEAKIVAQLDHPAILPIYGLSGDREKGLHLCMKLVNGETLTEYLKSVALSGNDSDAAIRRRIEIFIRVCDAITYAHARNIIHGDLKPDNIVVGEYGEVYVVDWGLSKKVGKDGFYRRPTFSGTPRYFAPETLRDWKIGKASEVFTLGLILQEIVTLQKATLGEGIAACNVVPLEQIYGVPINSALTAIIHKATAWEIKDRYASVEAFADDLRRYLSGDSISALPDNSFTQFARWAYRRRKECVAGALAILCIFAAIAAAAIFRQYKTARELHEQSRAINYLNDRTATVAAHLDITMLQIQEQLLALARICAYMLQHNNAAAPDAWKTAFLPSLSELNKSNDEMIYSPYYKRLVAMDYGIYQFAPTADREKGIEFMRHTSPVLCKMRNIVLGSQSGYSFDPADYERLKMAYLYSGFPVRSVYIGTENGLKLLYPWRGNYPREVDPRKREWYKLARDRRAPVWGKPYMDFDSVSGLSIPCSVPIIGFDDKVVGVVGLDLSINKITERILNKGNVGAYVIEKAVVTRSGEVVFSSRSKYFNKKFDPEKFHKDADFKLPLFETHEVRKRILDSGRDYGTFIIGNKIYSFAVLEVLDAFFVVVADYDKLKAHIRK